MKSFILFFIVVAPQLYSQTFKDIYPEREYISLDSLKAYSVKEYTLKTQDIYDIDSEIRIYNVFIGKAILLLSVLPDYEKDNYLWEEVNERDIPKNKILSEKNVETLAVNDFMFDENLYKGKTFRYKLIKRENGRYFISHRCFAELFIVEDYPKHIAAPYGVINTSEKKISIKQMKNLFAKNFPNIDFPLDIRISNVSQPADYPFIIKNYLSKTYKIGREKAYQFWTFDGWWITDGYNERRGIDRFVYIPNRGIVGGSYDFYFAFVPPLVRYRKNSPIPVSDELLWQNILNERVMIAEELK